MPNDKNDERLPHPDDPVTPRDYDPTHDKEFPHEEADITGDEEEERGGEKVLPDQDLRDNMGRPVGMRKPGEFIVPGNDDVDGDWTLPTRPGGGWDKALDHPLEEQIDEPETPDKTNQR